MNKPAVVFAAAAVLIAAFLIGAGQYRSQRAEALGFLAREDAAVFVPADAMTVGEANARVYLVEFFDPACETCRAMHGHVEQMLAANPGKIRLVLRYAPFHPGSDQVVKMLEASRRQGRYFETLELMFQYQELWASHHQPRLDVLWDLLPRAGLDIGRLRTDLDDPALDAIVQRDLADAETLGVRQTPEFFVNGKPLPSFGLQQLQTLVQAELQAQY